MSYRDELAAAHALIEEQAQLIRKLEAKPEDRWYVRAFLTWVTAHFRVFASVGVGLGLVVGIGVSCVLR